MRIETMEQLTGRRKATLISNVINIIVAITLVITAIVSLIQLRWFHRITIQEHSKYFILLLTSYSSFILLLLVGLILILVFVISCCCRNHHSVEFNQQEPQHQHQHHHLARQKLSDDDTSYYFVQHTYSIRSLCGLTLLYTLACLGLLAIIIVWLFNSGELVQVSVSQTLDHAYGQYQFANRSNAYSVAIDGMQDINNCCGKQEYNDFPRQRSSGLTAGHYPASCCGKNVFGVDVRGVQCSVEDIKRAKQTEGCVDVISDYYEIVSIVVVPASLVALFINIIVIAFITLDNGQRTGKLTSTIPSRVSDSNPFQTNVKHIFE